MVITWQLISVMLKFNALTPAALEAEYLTPFHTNGISVTYWGNILIPHLSAALLPLAVYLLINLWVVPSVRPILVNGIAGIRPIPLMKFFLSLLAVSFSLALTINVISWFGRPDFFNYGDYQFLAIAGYNDQPLADLFFGFGRALTATALVTSLIGLREWLVKWIERPGAARSYRILVANNSTPLFLLFFLPLLVISPLQEDVPQYVVLVLPVLALYLYQTFWLFPRNPLATLLTPTLAARLLPATVVGAAPSLILFGNRDQYYAFVLYWLFLLLIVTPLFWMLYQQRKDKILQLRGMETALATTSAQLQLLQSQINPHFLFNALNTLYGTALQGDNEKTAEGIQRLGDMMRHILHENAQEFIPLEKEIEYIRNFIALQNLRIQSSPEILIEDAIDECRSQLSIAPMLLIPFVENAFKHGIRLKEKSWIKIGLTCSDNNLCLEVKNSIHPWDHRLIQQKSGIGLVNVRERLKLLYAGRHTLDITQTESEYTVQLTLSC